MTGRQWVWAAVLGLKWALCYALLALCAALNVWFWGSILYLFTGSWVPIIILVAIPIMGVVISIPAINRVLGNVLYFRPITRCMNFVMAGHLIAKNGRMPIWGAVLLALAAASFATYLPVGA